MYNYGRLDLLLCKRLYMVIEKERSVLLQLKNELHETRGGKLYIKKAKNKVCYTEYYQGNEHGIGRNKNKVHRLARRNYIHDQYNLTKSYYSSLMQIFNQLHQDKMSLRLTHRLDQYESLGLDMNRILLSPKQQEWLNQPYERNPAYPEELKFKTSNDHLMRTKSELLIANRLEYYNIPYLPEKPLFFDYDLYPIYPDFTILKADGTEIIWEHMGLMDKEEYFIKNCRRIRRYTNNGYSLHTNLIITFEEDITTPGIIDHIIDTRILS